MDINVRMEGGLGDHLLANRFIPAILEKYPNGRVKVFSDTENNPNSLNLLLKFFPNFYLRGGEVIQERANKKFIIKSQFGEENYPCSIENQLESTKKRMINDCDIFYDLHIDSLNWTKHDYEWLRYYYHFPKPTGFAIEDQNFLLCHLYSRADSPYNMEKWYVESLINELSKNIKVKIVTQKEHEDFYASLKNKKNIEILTPEMPEVFSLASKCSAFIGIDSGIRYVPYHFSKPTFVFSKYCLDIGNVIYSHLIRWLIFKNQSLPIHFNIKNVSKIIQNSINDKAYYLFPEILDKHNDILVKRILV